MERILLVVTAVLALTCSLTSSLQADLETPKSVDQKATHSQVGTIKIRDADTPMPINAFSLNAAGQIVAACGIGPGEIRIVDDEGTILRSWAVDVKPEAINVADDGTILVGGEGKLFRYDPKGEELQQADSPHAAALRSSTETLRKEAIARIAQAANSLGSRIELFERLIDQLDKKLQKEDLNEQEEQMLERLPAMIESFIKQAEAQPETDDSAKEPTEEAIQAQVDNLLRSKMRISSISSNADHVFVATPGVSGYGYSVWKMDNEFSAGEVIVEGLRGCCGQMDVQCGKDGLFVAENSRHRVVRYDTDGEQVASWGKPDRTGVDGFSSCCNPMNVCVNGTNDLFTAESGTGRIKRFNADGEFLSYVGDVDLVPGCKNVSIAVTADSDKVYMLDLTRNHIVLMKTRPATSEMKAVTTTAKTATSVEGD